MSDLFQITTTNSGELAEVIDEETEYGREVSQHKDIWLRYFESMRHTSHHK